MSKKKKHPRLPVAHAFGPAYGKWLDLLAKPLLPTLWSLAYGTTSGGKIG